MLRPFLWLALALFLLSNTISCSSDEYKVLTLSSQSSIRQQTDMFGAYYVVESGNQLVAELVITNDREGDSFEMISFAFPENVKRFEFRDKQIRAANGYYQIHHRQYPLKIGVIRGKKTGNRTWHIEIDARIEGISSDHPKRILISDTFTVE